MPSRLPPRSSTLKAGSLPSSSFSPPSQVLRTPRTPSWLPALSVCPLYAWSLPNVDCQGGPLVFRSSPLQTCRHQYPESAHPPLRSQEDVCCLRRGMIGSAALNTFRLRICRGLLGVHSRYGPLARSLLYEAFDGPLGHRGFSPWLGPASECFGACSGGILTRGRGAAFTTHHAGSLPSGRCQRKALAVIRSRMAARAWVVRRPLSPAV